MISGGSGLYFGEVWRWDTGFFVWVEYKECVRIHWCGFIDW